VLAGGEVASDTGVVSRVGVAVGTAVAGKTGSQIICPILSGEPSRQFASNMASTVVPVAVARLKNASPAWIEYSTQPGGGGQLLGVGVLEAVAVADAVGVNVGVCVLVAVGELVAVCIGDGVTVAVCVSVAGAVDGSSMIASISLSFPVGGVTAVVGVSFPLSPLPAVKAAQPRIRHSGINKSGRKVCQRRLRKESTGLAYFCWAGAGGGGGGGKITGGGAAIMPFSSAAAT